MLLCVVDCGHAFCLMGAIAVAFCTRWSVLWDTQVCMGWNCEFWGQGQDSIQYEKDVSSLGSN